MEDQYEIIVRVVKYDTGELKCSSSVVEFDRIQFELNNIWHHTLKITTRDKLISQTVELK